MPICQPEASRARNGPEAEPDTPTERQRPQRPEKLVVVADEAVEDDAAQRTPGVRGALDAPLRGCNHVAPFGGDGSGGGGGCAEGSAEAAEAERRGGEGEGHGVAFAEEAARAAVAVGAGAGAGFEVVRDSVLVVGDAQDGVEVGEDEPRSGIFEAADYAGAEVWGLGAGGEPVADIPEELVGERVVEKAVIRLWRGVHVLHLCRG